MHISSLKWQMYRDIYQPPVVHLSKLFIGMDERRDGENTKEQQRRWQRAGEEKGGSQFGETERGETKRKGRAQK